MAKNMTVVELDLAGYSDIARGLEENLDVRVVAAFNDQIQGFVDAGLSGVNLPRQNIVMATTGDGAILAFDRAKEAHRFARAVHEASRSHNAGKTTASAMRWFRIGAATGEIVREPRDGGTVIAGTTIANAVRLEGAARVGQLLVDVATFSALPAELQGQYGAEEEVKGKREETFRARRCVMIPEGGETTSDPSLASTTSAPSLVSILDLFDRLNPRDQIQRLVLLIGMPKEHRPPDTIAIYRQQDQVLDWAAGRPNGLKALHEGLIFLIGKQAYP